MKKLSFLLVVAFMTLSSALTAQKPMIKFQEKEHDFGKINENDGKVTHVFEFTNAGNAVLIVQNVVAFCGCTTPEWTKTPIEPGKQGKVEVTYSPLGRPGPFTKQITVTSNATNEQEILHIKGEVLTANKQTEASPYPVTMGELGLRTTLVQVNNVLKGKSETRSIQIKNNGSAPVALSVLNAPNYLTVNAPATLKPGEENKIDFTFNSQKIATWGPVNDDVYVMINNKKILTNQYKMQVMANVVEDFSKMTREERANAPILELKSTNVFFGDLTLGHKVRGKIVIKNNGVNPLLIRRVLNNNAEIMIHPVALSVKGGKTGELKVDIDTKNLQKGEYKRIVTLQTNDPQNTNVAVNLSWNVK